MRRFYASATAARQADGWTLLLDERPVQTPARAPLVVPEASLAAALALEWDSQGETIDPRSMPLTGLANAAIDRVAPDPGAFAEGLARYAESDLLCYRADAPAALVAGQAAAWDPILAWARRRYDVDFVITTGVVHRPQPRATLTRLGHAIAILDPFVLAAMSPLVTVSGSLVVALAIAEQALGTAAAWAAASVDERWQIDTWGADSEAVTALAARRDDFHAGIRFLDLLRG